VDIPTDQTPVAPEAVAVGPMLRTPEYSSIPQLAGAPPAMLIVKTAEATEPPAGVDHTSDLRVVPLLA
jgi:hypothetical protein